jgi:hypothetical protein
MKILDEGVLVVGRSESRQLDTVEYYEGWTCRRLLNNVHDTTVKLRC